MRAWSWMAALALIGVSSVLIGRGLSAQATGRGQEPGPSTGAKTTGDHPGTGSSKAEGTQADMPADRSKPPTTKLPTLQINLAIAGLGAEGCEVEIKPANPSCKFRASPRKHVESDGRAMIELRNIELRGADRTCTVAITVREPGQDPQTIYRGFRTSSAKPGATPSFTCFISSRLASVETGKTTRK